MNLLAKSLVPLAILAVPALAGIDSGGGKSSGGTTVNHSSIGEPFATQPTQGRLTRNQPTWSRCKTLTDYGTEKVCEFDETTVISGLLNHHAHLPFSCFPVGENL
jgi:hypothetical protein